MKYKIARYFKVSIVENFQLMNHFIPEGFAQIKFYIT